MYVKFKSDALEIGAKDFLVTIGHILEEGADALFKSLTNGGQRITRENPRKEVVETLAQNGFVYFESKLNKREISIFPCKGSFNLDKKIEIDPGTWKIPRLAFLRAEGGFLYAQHPDADCYLCIESDRAATFLVSFSKGRNTNDIKKCEGDKGIEWSSIFARAGVIQQCDDSGDSKDDTDSSRRQWDFHEALFHSQSRLGRTDNPIGATWQFKGQIEQAPAIKAHEWTEKVIPLPRPDPIYLMMNDMSLFMAMETRRSVRHNSIVPPSLNELGILLFRSLRIRNVKHADDSTYAYRPHPGGGGIYENEIYITINQCQDLPRGFYYYDPLNHALCHISDPDQNMEGLLQEAQVATAGICRPQILLTISARHTRFGWKYSGMGYAAQLKNVGVIYQTLYLVATAMGLGGCGLGLGNSDRLCTMADLDWWEEGSVGEFIIGRPL